MLSGEIQNGRGEQFSANFDNIRKLEISMNSASKGRN